LRHWGVLVLVLLAIEGLAIVADHQWSFRARLLGAFAAATRGERDEDALWADPERPFASTDGSSDQALRFRLAGSDDPIGEEIDPAHLPPGKRVVVLGESAAFGVGCRSEEAFAALLDDALRAKGTHVLNAGQVGADTWQVMDAGAQILSRYSPTALVIFTGNNPWIDWAPPQQPRWNPWAIKVLSGLATSRAIAGLEFLSLRWTLLHTSRDWRVERLGRLDSWIGWLRREPAAAFHDHYELAGSGYALAHPLEETEQFGAADWPRVKALYLRRFETSLVQLIEHARARGVRVVLATVPFNYRLSPAWKHPQFEAVDPAHRDEVRALVREAGALVQAGDCRAAQPRIDRAVALDPLPPLPHYLRAQCLEQMGDLDAAEAAYAQSRELMIGNLGSRLSVNDVIRRVAERFDVPFVDVARIFDDYEHSIGHHFNEDLIIDDCHPSPLGHQLIANALGPLL
jgi:lysophospholipase L1-like esterase